MILHLITVETWAALADAQKYTPESLAAQGFIHCSGDDDVMLDVANSHYADAGEVLVLTIDEHDLDAEVRWEAPNPLPPGWDPNGPEGAPTFPHIYGPLNLDAVVGIRRLLRDNGGRFAGYASA